MSDETKKASAAKKITFSSLMENNKFVFAFSLIISIIVWCGVSMYQTPVTERTIQNVKVQLNLEGSLPYNKGLQIYGQTEYNVDVSVRGKSYLVNDSGFTADKITVSANMASVSSAGTYTLPITASLNGVSNDVEITNVSKNFIDVYFDEPATKTFELTEEVKELDGYSIAAGYERENPRLSTDTVSLTGPALEIAKITKVTALVELNTELTKTETFEARIIPSGSSENAKFENVKVNTTEPVYITVPISFAGEYKPVVTFTNAPQAYRETPIAYSVNPGSVKVTVPSSDNDLVNSDSFAIGTVDFSKINNIVNYIKINTADLSYNFLDGITTFTVTIDASSMQKRWLEIPVKTDDVTIPANCTVVSSSVLSVQVIGPSSSVDGIDSSALYATPVFDGVELTPGTNYVPAKLSFKTLTDSWVYGTYTIEVYYAG